MCPVLPQEKHWAVMFFSLTKQRKQVMFPSLLPEPLALSSNLSLSNLDLELEKTDNHIWLSDVPILLIQNGNMQLTTSRGNPWLFGSWTQTSCCCAHNRIVPGIFPKPSISRMCVNRAYNQLCHSKVPWRDWSPHGMGWPALRCALYFGSLASTAPRHTAEVSLCFPSPQAVCGTSLYLNKEKIFIRLRFWGLENCLIHGNTISG